MIEMHVGLLHDLAEGCEGFLPLVAIEVDGPTRPQLFRIGDVDTMVATIMGFDCHPRINLYMPWHVVRKDLERGKRGGETDIVACLAAVADIDNDKHTFGELPVEPSYIVETSPGNFQPTYFFDRPLPVSEAKPVLEALADFVGGDCGTKDAAHVWRIPGTVNIPTKSKLERGRSPIPVPVAIKKPFDGRLIAASKLLALAPKKPKPNGDAHAGHQHSGSLSTSDAERLREALNAIPAHDRETWLKVGMALHTVGARELWDDWSKTSDKFDEGEQGKAWASFKTERNGDIVTVATIFGMARGRGWTQAGNGLDYVPPGKLPSPKRKMVLEWFTDAADSALIEPDDPLIEDLLDQGALSVVYGDSASGKSFGVMSLAHHVSTGMEWNGKRVRRGLVVYLAAEGGRRIKRRLAALKKRYQEECGESAIAPLFALVRYPVNLRSSDADLNELLALVRAAEEETAEKCVWLIVDTLSRAIAGGDENSSVDMGLIVCAADKFRDETGAHFTYIHHTGKDAARGARGHSLLRAATDTEIETTTTAMTVTKQRDMEGGFTAGFKLVDSTLGFDTNGNQVKSATVEWSTVAKKAKPRAKLTAGAINVFSALNYAISEVGANPPASNHVPAGVKTVTLTQWRTYFDNRTNLDNPDSRKKAFERGSAELQSRDSVGIWQAYAWVR